MSVAGDPAAMPAYHCDHCLRPPRRRTGFIFFLVSMFLLGRLFLAKESPQNLGNSSRKFSARPMETYSMLTVCSQQCKAFLIVIVLVKRQIVDQRGVRQTVELLLNIFCVFYRIYCIQLM